MKDLPISILNSNEVYTVSSRIGKVLSTTLSGDNYVTTHNHSLTEAVQNMARALGRELGSNYTSLLATADVKRDNGFLALREYVNSECYGTNPKRVAAAEKIKYTIYNIGGSIFSLGYVAETAHLNSLFSELDESDKQQALETIDAKQKYETLKTAQQSFEQLNKDKAETEAQINYPLVRESIKQISTLLGWLLSYVESNASVNKEGFAKAEDEINEIITDIVAIARARKTKNENEQEITEEL